MSAVAIVRRALPFLLFAGCAATIAAPVTPDRPFIWVAASDRAAILAKIESKAWAQTVFTAMQDRVRQDVAAHGRDADAFLRGLPLIAAPQGGGRHPVFALIGGDMASTGGGGRAHSLQHYLHIATDCAVLFYLTEEERYAQCAADILQAASGALAQMPRNDATTQGGIVYPQDVLYESRSVGAQLPIVYDFLSPWLQGDARVHDLVSRQRVPFDFPRAQQVFRAYAHLIVEHGQIDSNHPVLEMPCLALNALALDDPRERAEMLAYLTHRDTPHQDSLKKVMAVFAQAGGIWPESFQYSVGVSARVTYLTALLRRQSPPAIALDGFAGFPLSLVRLTDFRFPNGQNVRVGDGPRRSSQPWDALEIGYALALREGDVGLQRQFGALLNLDIAEGRYNRAQPHEPRPGADSYQGPLQLLWFAPEIAGTMEAPAPRTTDTLPFAGLVLQRSFSPTHDPTNDLMATVSGASFVHSHASGMTLELYGAGQVLGVNAGKGTYRSNDHENYRRLFAAYNGVIVNGASRSGGGWVNLGIDTVRPVAAEPAFGAAPVSANHSFTVTQFTDHELGGGTAQQQRLVGIVRTSPTTGYYVDVFRSRGSSAEQYHDYLYHNLGESASVATRRGPLALVDAPDRFRPAPGATWAQNRAFLWPGWHVFKAVRASAPISEDVSVLFSASRLKPAAAFMRVWLSGTEGREYAVASAPETKEAPAPYDHAPTPVLVVRQRGEAWKRPFAAIYEPFGGSAKNGHVVGVHALRPSGDFAGLKVESRVDGQPCTQYLLVCPAADEVYEDAALGIAFRGRYGVITLDGRGAVVGLYVGEGTSLRYRDYRLAAGGAAFADLSASQPTVVAASAATLTLPDRRVVQSRRP